MNQNNKKSALAAMQTGDLLEKAKDLLSTLGYRSDLILDLSGSVDDFFEGFPHKNPNTKTEQNFRENAESVQIIFQFTKDEIVDENISKSFDKEDERSFLFSAVELKDDTYSRTKYAEFTREINKRLNAPTVILFRAGDCLTIAFADRRPSETDETVDVLGQVTLIKDIRLNNPHRAHLDILSELSLEQCIKWMDDKSETQNFDGLLAAWLAKLDTEELNKKFYRKLFAWYEWAVETSRFPTDENQVIKAEEHVIRLITRLLFIWFIKEKGLVAEELFNRFEVLELLKEDDLENGDAYYRVVLQNLFFATLNTEIGKREFSRGGNTNHRNFSKFRYKDQMDDPDKLLDLFSKTPFINGGLFDCLDSFDATRDGGYRIDCFSDKQYHKLSIPNRVFFDAQQGLIPLLEHYKFTVEENTPIDQEVALDPELLGRVFENLLAAINPETGETARKMTGSYYTPRAIVDYMVEETLVAALSQKCQPTDGNETPWDERLRYLFDYAKMFDDASEWFDDNETDAIVKIISELKILDPAVGSGAFPMGTLHKLTLALRRLDPDNIRWETLQKELAAKRAAAAFDTQDDQERREELHEIDDTFKRYRDSDFGRKLYLIQNSIFGVDIQPIACQIAKLRFFISLAIEQEPDIDAVNFGIKPLPNLETRFVASNTLIGLKQQMSLKSQKASQLEQKLRINREKHFHATTRQQKRDCKDRDEELRSELATEVKNLGTFTDDADNIAKWDPYDQNNNADWFDSELMFGVTDGFDVVIGNPPYIQLQKDGGRLADLYQPCEFDTFTRTGDIYCLFYEKGHKFLKSRGHLCFITSNKWMRAGYGKKLRDYFVVFTQPVQLLDMGPDVFDATVDTNILLLQNNSIFDGLTTFKGVSIGTDFDRQTGNIHQYLKDNGVTMEVPAEGEPWAILSFAEFVIKRKIEDVGTPLKDWDINIYRGIVTGCNEAFIIDEAKREELVAQDPKSAEIIKPLLRGRDIERYHVKQAGFYILATGYDLDIPNKYPVIYEHLETIGKQIELGEIKVKGKGLFSRDDQGENWWNLRACAYYSEFEKEKIVYPDISSSMRACYDTTKALCLQTTYILPTNDLSLFAILNSRLFDWYAKYKFQNLNDPWAGGGLRFIAQYMEKVPIAKRTPEQKAELSELVEQILENPAGEKVSDLEKEIDTLVYRLYELSAQEIVLIEQTYRDAGIAV